MSQAQKVVVESTDDLSIFNMLRGNRGIDPQHVERIMLSLVSVNLLHAQPLIVNEKMEVIDGQHRLTAVKNLAKGVEINGKRYRMSLEVYFIVVPGLTLEDVTVLNTNNSNWGIGDYMESYVDLGYEDYKVFKEFRERYNLPYSTALMFMAGTRTEKGLSTEFRRGDFKVTDLELAEVLAEGHKNFEVFYEGYKRKSFAKAVWMLFKNSDYNHQRMLDKLDKQGGRLRDCVSATDYLRILETIYNHGESASNTVWFR